MSPPRIPRHADLCAPRARGPGLRTVAFSFLTGARTFPPPFLLTEPHYSSSGKAGPILLTEPHYSPGRKAGPGIPLETHANSQRISAKLYRTLRVPLPMHTGYSLGHKYTARVKKLPNQRGKFSQRARAPTRVSGNFPPQFLMNFAWESTPPAIFPTFSFTATSRQKGKFPHGFLRYTYGQVCRTAGPTYVHSTHDSSRI